VAKKVKVWLTADSRAEAEHALGKVLESDPSDPRFVLVTPELAEQIQNLPQGIPIQRGQSKRDGHDKVQKIVEAQNAPVGKLEGKPDEDADANGSGSGVATTGRGVSEGDTVAADGEAKRAQAAKDDSK
jgi:hypothetical protein